MFYGAQNAFQLYNVRVRVSLHSNILENGNRSILKTFFLLRFYMNMVHWLHTYTVEKAVG